MKRVTSFKFLFALIFYSTANADDINFELIDVGRPCQMQIDLFRMWETSIHAGIANLHWYQTKNMLDDKRDCEFFVKGFYLYDKLAVQFTRIDWGNNDCVTIKNRNRMYGIKNYRTIAEYCGNSIPLHKIHTTDAEQDLVLSFKFKSTGYKKLDMAFNVFHTNGECDQYECDNGRCIPEDIECNDYNPCGDESSCKNLTGWEIFGIVAGCLAGTVFLCWCCCCRKSEKETPLNPDMNTPPAGIQTTNQPEELLPLGTSTNHHSLNQLDQEFDQTLAFLQQIADDGSNSTPVYVHPAVSNQNDNNAPPNYSTLENTHPTNSHHYNVPAVSVSGNSADYSIGPGHDATTDGPSVAPSAPPVAGDNEGLPPPPSYDDVIAHGDKYKVT